MRPENRPAEGPDQVDISPLYRCLRQQLALMRQGRAAGLTAAKAIGDIVDAADKQLAHGPGPTIEQVKETRLQTGCVERYDKQYLRVGDHSFWFDPGCDLKNETAARPPLPRRPAP
jgi:hypothetical protein